MRTSFEITAADCWNAAVEPGGVEPGGVGSGGVGSGAVDPSAPGAGSHLPFHSILQRCATAWLHYLDATVPGAETGVIVPNVNASFTAEVRPGRLDVDVEPVRIGTTSFTVRCDVSQDGVRAASVEVVLVRFDYDARTPLPLTAEERDLLTPQRPAS